MIPGRLMERWIDSWNVGSHHVETGDSRPPLALPFDGPRLTRVLSRKR